jgi:hypothetical protein
MEPILIYGFPAGSSMGLVAAFETLGQPYRLCRVDMLNEMKTEAYARINGRQETPVLITDDGRSLTETMAIAAWLEARDQDRRISFEPRSRDADRMHQLMAFVNTGFTSAFSPLCRLPTRRWLAWRDGRSFTTLSILPPIRNSQDCAARSKPIRPCNSPRRSRMERRRPARVHSRDTSRLAKSSIPSANNGSHSAGVGQSGACRSQPLSQGRCRG